jgi:hypothetical protein
MAFKYLADATVATGVTMSRIEFWMNSITI